jgi:hypothetical protein
MSCEPRFNGESYGWEAQILERVELFAAIERSWGVMADVHLTARDYGLRPSAGTT